MATAQTTEKKAAAKAAKPVKKDPTKAKADAIAEAKSFAPDLAARIGSTPKTKFRGNPDIFGRLVQDHDKHRALIAMIEKATSAEVTGLPSWNTAFLRRFSVSDLPSSESFQLSAR